MRGHARCCGRVSGLHRLPLSGGLTSAAFFAQPEAAADPPMAEESAAAAVAAPTKEDAQGAEMTFDVGAESGGPADSVGDKAAVSENGEGALAVGGDGEAVTEAKVNATAAVSPPDVTPPANSQKTSSTAVLAPTADVKGCEPFDLNQVRLRESLWWVFSTLTRISPRRLSRRRVTNGQRRSLSQALRAAGRNKSLKSLHCTGVAPTFPRLLSWILQLLQLRSRFEKLRGLPRRLGES